MVTGHGICIQSDARYNYLYPVWTPINIFKNVQVNHRYWPILTFYNNTKLNVIPEQVHVGAAATGFPTEFQQKPQTKS